MLLTPQHRRSARVAARMQKTVQQDFNERVANGTMTKEELLNAPTCLRSFDEAEDAILAQSDEEEDEPTRKVKRLLKGRVLTEDPLVLKLIVSKLPTPLVSAIVQQLILEMKDLERGIDDAKTADEVDAVLEEEEDSIASRLLKRRRMERARGQF